MTGVLVLETGKSWLLQPVKNSRLPSSNFPQSRKDAKEGKRENFASLRLFGKFASALFVMVPLRCGAFVWLLRQRFTGHTILALNPLAQVDKLAPLRTEGTKRIVFPLDLLTAGWTFHES